MHDFSVLAITPSGCTSPTIAIAACRAQACGCLDLEFCLDPREGLEALDRLAEHVPAGGYGVKIGPEQTALLAELSGERFPGLSTIILGGGPAAWSKAALRKLQLDGTRRLLCEVVSMTEAAEAAKLGCDGLILKGHEAGGRVGSETAFILLQSWRQRFETGELKIPAWVQGGIGPNAAAACALGGAAGVVLDAQLWLTRETPFPALMQSMLRASDGSETLLLKAGEGSSYRVFQRPGAASIARAQEALERLAAASSPKQQAGLRAEVLNSAGLDPKQQLLLAGQDMALAASLADRFRTTGGVITAVLSQIEQNLASARRLQPLAPGAPLAESHGTKYPIIQGPMTRVSDTPEFAEAVGKAGALPLLALALLRKPEAEQLVSATKAKLDGTPWGVGLLGFLPPDIRKEQIEVIQRHKPPFALIAGGRPDQAKELEDVGIETYLHVPSPGLLKMFLKDGARRFVFEGRECGGHVGPRSSFLLWETMCQLLLEQTAKLEDPSQLHIVFAGGIHDATSAAMVAALAAPLAERGMRIGVLMGTAYLFTQEAVSCGAIVPRFQKESLGCQETVLLETGPGHAIRCIKTPYYDTFETERRRLKAEGRSHEEIVKSLEWQNVGRLRVASKGLDRVKQADGRSKLSTVSDEEQFSRGMYMIGQVAGLRHEVTTMEKLHDDVSRGGAEILAEQRLEPPTTAADKPCDVAIIGMSCFYPKGNTVRAYWENILNRVNAVTEVPASHWDWRTYYDPNPRARDKIISKWGGFLSDVHFDPFQYGITPASIPSVEPLQLLLLEAVQHGLKDAGYLDRPFNRERTAAILGIGGGGSPMAVAYGFRTCMPFLDSIPNVPVKSTEVVEYGREMLPEWTEDSFPGILPNVAVGRVANRFNFGGTNMAIDAACASSLAAVHSCVRELEMGTADVAVAMGADTVQTPYAYMAFSKTHALSPRGQCRPFDESADGIALSEGVGVVVLKRLADAERDGDTIYAVIKGVGSSSDGKEKGLTAPNAAGQLRALRRAYSKAGIDPARVELIEAHGTGTVVGDRTEAQSLAAVLQEAGAPLQSCALGSVKSMIGHSKCAAGLAGLIKTTLALHHKVLPPTLVEKPNERAQFHTGPLYLNTQARPWVHRRDLPRVAGVSAFGFGGTNFHVVLEEYTQNYVESEKPPRQHWPAELFLFRQANKSELRKSIEQCAKGLRDGASAEPSDLAASLWRACDTDPAAPTLAVVAVSLEELKDRIPQALKMVDGAEAIARDPRGIYYNAEPQKETGKVAMLFPGQGSQYPNMLAETAMAFEEVRDLFDTAHDVLAGAFERPLASYMFPPSPFSPEDEKLQQTELARTDIAQPAIGTASLGMLRLLRNLGVDADLLAGHSYGEYVALCAAGVMSEDDLLRVSLERGRLMHQAAEGSTGQMAAVDCDGATAEKLFAGIADLTVANFNSPKQTIVSGTAAAMKSAMERSADAGLRGRLLPVSCAFHSPLVSDACGPLEKALAEFKFGEATHPVFSNTTAEPHPSDSKNLAARLADHLKSPVRFTDEIEALYENGARVFLEVGPQAVLTSLVGQILGDRPHVAVASDSKGRNALVHLNHMLAQLLVAGIDVKLDRLFQGREQKPFDIAKLPQQSTEPETKPSTWVVNSVRCRPLKGKEPRLLGQAYTGANAASAKPQPTAATPATPAAKQVPSPAPPTTPSAPANVPPQHPAAVAQEKRSMPSPSTASPAANGQSPTSHAAPAPAPSYGTPSAATPTARPVPDQANSQVMLRFQEVMSQFLETQQQVMMSYLQGGQQGSRPAAAARPASYLPQQQAAPQAPAQPVAQPYTNGAAPAVNGTPAPAEPAHQPRFEMPQPSAATNGAVEEAASPPAETSAETPSAPAPAAANGEKPKIDAAWLKQQLLHLVSERTGYPEEMLDLDLDLEADLGIDSIKRVEILGTLAEDLGGTEMLESNVELEKLTGIKTLRGIIDYLDVALSDYGPAAEAVASTPEAAAETNGAATTPAMSAAAAAGAAMTNGEVDIQRATVKLVEAPLPSGSSMVIPSGAVLITDDESGIAAQVADRLADFGQRTVLLRHGKPDGSDQPGELYTCDLTDAAAVQALVGKLQQEVEEIGGLVHLLPLGGSELLAPQRARRDVKSLYLLAQALEIDLRAAGEEGSAILLAATGLGGGFGYGDDDLPAEYFAGHGGVLGFVKCLGMEFPEVLVRGVDFDPSLSAEDLADRLLSELGDPNGPSEIGYLDGRRVTWEPVPASFSGDEPEQIKITSKDRILVTGGARGITSAIAAKMAERYQCELVLLGRSPLPVGEESATTAGLETPAEIKAALIAAAKKSGGAAAPAEIEAEYQRLMRDREIRGTLDAIRTAGGKVEYHAIDVRDEKAMTKLVKDLQARGGIQGVLHGAGVIDDKLVKDKTPESFDRVFSTKVDSADILVRLLDPKQLKFCVFFASIASRYGNKGQADYAAANEVLSKLACQLDRAWPCRVVSIAWGPWSELGMVSHLERHLTARGLKLISPEEGPKFLIDEIVHGCKGASEVLVAGGAERVVQPPRAQPREVAAR